MFKKFLQNRQCSEVPLRDIDPEDTTTSFSFFFHAGDLLASIKEHGIYNPVYLIEQNGKKPLVPVCGHRRLDAARRLGMEKIPAYLLNEAPKDPQDLLLFNVLENATFRTFNAIEVSNILAEFQGFGMEKERVVGEIMPVLGLEKSRKIFQDYLSVQKLIPDFKNYLARIHAPLKLLAGIARWEEKDQKALYSVVDGFQPGMNRLREIWERLEEIGLRDRISPDEILKHQEIHSIVQAEELSPADKVRRFLDLLHNLRYPMLSGKRTSMQGKLRELPCPKGAELRYPKNFEGKELTLSLRFSTRQELFARLEEVRSRWGEEKVEEILRLLQD